MDAETRKRVLRGFFEPVVDALGYRFSQDTELVEELLKQEVLIEQKHGSPFCPRQPMRHNREHDMKIVCPCIPFHRKHFDAMKRCWCGLFVHKDVTDPNTLRQTSPREAGIERPRR